MGNVEHHTAFRSRVPLTPVTNASDPNCVCATYTTKPR